MKKETMTMKEETKKDWKEAAIIDKENAIVYIDSEFFKDSKEKAVEVIKEILKGLPDDGIVLCSLKYDKESEIFNELRRMNRRIKGTNIHFHDYRPQLFRSQKMIGVLKKGDAITINKDKLPVIIGSREELIKNNSLAGGWIKDKVNKGRTVESIEELIEKIAKAKQ